ncbi:low affinity iron permease family protein [Cupriavidus sp. TMH.W2]|uniref:low affinity iron permease family protein n=1 Tax=Cupriavidus sp. TMH.W2 TaxID=3434465 RepID=UPI003D77A135
MIPLPKAAVAVRLKLNELLASHRDASHVLGSIEELDEEELRQLVNFYRHLAELADKEAGIKSSHSLDEARTAGSSPATATVAGS